MFDLLPTSSELADLKFHVIDDVASHKLAKSIFIGPQVFSCVCCNAEFSKKELLEHLMIRHFRVQRSILDESLRNGKIYECISCRRKMKNVLNVGAIQHAEESQKHSAMKPELRCFVFNHFFESTHQLKIIALRYCI